MVTKGSIKHTTGEIVHRVHQSLRFSRISWPDIAQHLGISTAQAYKIKSGQASFRASHVLPLCELTGLSPNQLFGFKDEERERVMEETSVVSATLTGLLQELGKLDRRLAKAKGLPLFREDRTLKELIQLDP